jgi:hypothetical protein
VCGGHEAGAGGRRGSCLASEPAKTGFYAMKGNINIRVRTILPSLTMPTRIGLIIISDTLAFYILPLNSLQDAAGLASSTRSHASRDQNPR